MAISKDFIVKNGLQVLGVGSAQSTSTTTGALIVTGGAGIGGDLNVNGLAKLNTLYTADGAGISGNLAVTGTAVISGITTVTNTTSATDQNTGALVVKGGVGISGDIYASNLYSNGILVGSTPSQFNTTVTFTTTTNSTSTSTGAIIVKGGVGIAQDLWLGGDLNVYGTIYMKGVGLDTISGSTGTFDFLIAEGTGTSLAVKYDATVGGNLTATTLNVVNQSTLQNVTAGIVTATSLQTTGPANLDSLYVKNAAGINGNLSVTGTSALSGIVQILNATDATTSSGTSGALQVAGGVSIAKTLWVGSDTTFAGPVTFNGGATYVYSTNTVYTDNILELHTPPGGVGSTWPSNDGKDIGLRMHYYAAGADQNAALVLAADTRYLEWYSTGAEGTSTFAGSTYGTFKTGNVIATGTLTGVDLTLSGNAGVTGNLNVTAQTTLGSASATTFTATTAQINSTLAVTGQTTLANASATTFTATSLNVSGSSTLAGAVHITDTTPAATSGTGALVVDGGASVGGNFWVNGTLYQGGSAVLTQGSISSNAVSSIAAGTDTAVSTSTGAVTIWNTSNLQSITDRGSNTSNAIHITNNTAAINASTGSLVVTGGVGVGGAVYAGGLVTANSLYVANDAGVNGNLAVTGTTALTGAVTVGPASQYTSFASAAVSSNATVPLDNFSSSIYRTAKYVCQVVDTGATPNKVQVEEFLVFHDNNGASTVAYIISYGIGTNTGELGTWDAVYNAGTITLQFTPNYTPSSMVVKTMRTAITT
jgi:hypothetical protein